MKLTKEQVYVVIDNQADCDRAIDILNRAGEPMWKNEIAFKFREGKNYLIRCNDGDWLIDSEPRHKTKITLNELESLLTPKIKKSELQKRIEVLEKKVAELEEIAKVTIEVEADKPQFEVGKVYKLHDTKIMFYCTDANLDVYGFGFDKNGRWTEKSFFSSSNITEATPEEWFKRLEEEYNRRGFKKGVTFNNSKVYNRSFENAEMNVDFLQLRGLNILSVNEYKDATEWYEIMKDGKWAEIIEEPQYQPGTLGAFWDGDWDEAINNGDVKVDKLGDITEKGHFKRKDSSVPWENFKPLKFD